MNTIKPRALKVGDTIGVCTPSHPSYSANEEMFSLAITNIEKQGFKVRLGSLTKERKSQGYRSGTAKDRAKEFMDLIEDDQVDAILTTIGGNNSASLIPYLDFEKIRDKRKILCGYSDITSLHLAILHYSGLRTLYGTAAMVWFGEYPNGETHTIEAFKKAAMNTESSPREIVPFEKWSNHFREWDNGDWKNVAREWKTNKGWYTLSKGASESQIIAANLATLMTSAGTPYFPNLEDKILMIESMSAPWAFEERYLTQLKLMGVFEKISGLIVGKPEHPNDQGSGISHNDLIKEVIGERDYPIVTEFDCSHTIPMNTIAQDSLVRLVASGGYDVKLTFMENFVDI